jgi:hypothetical protein
MSNEYWGDGGPEDDAEFDLDAMKAAFDAGMDAAVNGLPEHDENEVPVFDSTDDGDTDVLDPEDIEEALTDLDSILDDLGPPAVMEAVSAFLYELDRPFHRIAKKLNDLAQRTRRAAGAVEEGKQTRGINE